MRNENGTPPDGDMKDGRGAGGDAEMVITRLDDGALRVLDPCLVPAPPSAPLHIELYRETADGTVSFADARITEEGALEVSAEEIGKRPRESLDFNDYEWWVTVSPEHKDEVLLALLEALYGGNWRAVDAFAEFLDARGIPHAFDTWRTDPAHPWEATRQLH